MESTLALFSSLRLHLSQVQVLQTFPNHLRPNLMPPKKIIWGDVPNNTFVKKKKMRLLENGQNVVYVVLSSCPGFNYGQNSELLQLYNKYKKSECLNESFIIHYQNVVWSTHSVDCTNEAIIIQQKLWYHMQILGPTIVSHHVKNGGDVAGRPRRVKKIGLMILFLSIQSF